MEVSNPKYDNVARVITVSTCLLESIILEFVTSSSVIYHKMAELLLDSNIRLWVFLPIIMITFLVGILRHYFSLIISSQKKVELLQVQDR